MGFHKLILYVLFFFRQIVSAMVNNDLLSLVNTRPLKFWKETLALLCSVSFIFNSEKNSLYKNGDDKNCLLEFMCKGS